METQRIFFEIETERAQKDFSGLQVQACSKCGSLILVGRHVQADMDISLDTIPPFARIGA
jgi:hypothetical protein